MGNVCCTDRRLTKPDQPKPLNPVSKQSKLDNIHKKPAHSQQLSNYKEFSPSPIHQMPHSSSLNIDINESLIQELEYDLKEVHDLTESEQQSIIKVFNIYKSELPLTEEEFFEGFSYIKVRESDSLTEDRVILLSNYALYILKHNDFSHVYRRVNLKNIQIILLENTLKSFIIHIAKNDILGDLWLFSKQLEDIHNCIQTMFKYLTQRFIPIHSFPENQLKNVFNDIPATLFQTLLEDDNLKTNNVIVAEGKIGEIILLRQKSHCLINGENVECLAVLTNKGLYCLTTDFKFVSKLDLKNVKSVLITENMDKLLIEKSNAEYEFWILGNRFLTEFEKSIILVRGERVPIIKKSVINIEDYIPRLRKKFSRS